MPKRISIPFVSTSKDSLDRSGMSSAKMVNMYAEEFNGKVCAIGTPGLSTWYNALAGTPVTTTVRGMINYQETGYTVIGNTVYKITFSGSSPVFTSLGTIATSSGKVNFCGIANAQIVMLNDGVNTYSITGATPPGTLNNLTGSGNVPASVIRTVSKDGFFLYLTQTNNQVWVSDVAATTVGALAFFGVNSNLDKLISAATNDQFIYFFCQYSTEIWYNAGTSVQPFARIPGGVLQLGIAAKDSALTINENTYFLAQTPSGLMGIVMINGPNQQVISDSFLTSKISGYASISDAYAWTYSENGHIFYCITFPNAGATAPIVGKTWAFDTTNGAWSELTSYDPVYLMQNRHPANCSMFINNQQVVGDYQSGYLYTIKQTNLSDTIQGASSPIQRTLIGPHIIDRDTFFTMNNVEIDIERGMGLDGSGQGSSPTVAFSVSYDKGHTYTTPTTLAVTPFGQYKNRIRKGGCGSGFTFTHKLEMSDPIRWRVYGITAEVGASFGRLNINYG